MGGGVSKKKWERQFHLSSNVPDKTGDSYQQIFPVWTIAITRNQRQLASATSDHRISLWCLATHQLLIALRGHADTIWCLSYSPDDTLLASASADGTVRLWEVNTGLPVMILPRSHANWVWCLDWSPDGSMLATGGSDARILIWDAAEAAHMAGRVQMMQMNAEEDDSWLEAAAIEAEKAAQASAPLLYWQAHEKSIHQVAFAPGEPRMLISVGQEGTLAVWDAKTGELDCRLMGHIGPITCCAVSPRSEEIVATGGEDHTVRIWDLSDIDPASVNAHISREKPLGFNLAHFTLKGHEGGISAIKFCADGQLLASASKDCEVRIWFPSAENPTLCAKFMAHEAWVRNICWTLDQHFLFSCSTDGLIFAWQVPKKFHKREIKVKKKGNKRYE